MIDIIQEIVSSLSRNKLRTALTGFSVAWGIFILIVLLGSGNGLINAFEYNSSQQSLNSGTIYSGWTSKDYGGFNAGRRIDFKATDTELIQRLLSKHVQDMGGNLWLSDKIVSYGQNYQSAGIRGVFPNYTDMWRCKILKGRFINQNDMDQKRKAAVIGTRLSDVLFKDMDRDEIIGKFFNASGVAYKVIGIYETDKNDGRDVIYLPFNTVQTIYMTGNYVDEIIFTSKGLSSIEDNEAFEEDIKRVLAASHHFAPDDDGALGIWNRMKQYLQTQGGMSILTTSIWVIGILTLISGIVGVSNIMLITVKERTREFGIRKALGAKPNSILALVIAESVAITALFGYIGMVAGIGLTELMDMMTGTKEMDSGVWSEVVFLNPTVEISTAIEATLVLIIAGTIAGLIPARKAVSIRPIEALRAE